MVRWPNGGVFELTILEERPGFTSLLIEGKDCYEIFKNEIGGHRWQAPSPTDKKKSIHTSTVTVALLEKAKADFELDISDIRYITARGSGKGGQHRNVTDSCVTAIHKPTGLSVRIDARHQHKNKALATRLLAERVGDRERAMASSERHANRSRQVGSGMRGDKRRTYRTKDNSIVDHVTGKSWRLKKWMRGEW